MRDPDELRAKVREANRLSTAIRRALHCVRVSVDGVRRGDVVAVGGVPHRIRDVRQLRGRRKRLEFEDGNVYVLTPWAALTVTREHRPDGP